MCRDNLYEQGEKRFFQAPLIIHKLVLASFNSEAPKDVEMARKLRLAIAFATTVIPLA